MVKSKKVAPEKVKKERKVKPKVGATKDNARKVKGSGEPADDVLKLIQDLNPGAQGLIHRFSLHLQASIARKGMVWSNIAVLMLAITLSFVAIYQSSAVRIVGIDAFGRMYDVTTRSSSDYQYTNAQIAEFSNEAIIETFDLKFTNFSRRLERTGNKYYTASGKAELGQAMKSLILDIQTNQAVVHAESAGESEIVGYDSSRKLWKVRKPLYITFSPAEGSKITNKRVITLIIKRLDDYDSLKGIAIEQINQGK